MKKIFTFCFVCLFIGAHAQIKKPVKWSFKATSLSNKEIQISFIATIDKHWHIYSQHIAEGGPVPTKFKLTPSADFELLGGVSEDSKVIKAYDQTFGMDLLWFEKSAIFSQKIKVKNTSAIVKGLVEFMVCDDTQCLPPDELEFSIPVKVEEEKSSKKDTSLVTIPQKDTVIQEASTATLPVASVDTVSKAQISSTTLPPKEEQQALLLTFVAGLLGGFAALLMPCIFPMLPMTVSFFTKQASSKSNGITKSLVYGLSIIVIYVALGLLITVFFGADALNDLSTNGIFNLVFFVMLIVFAASFFGAFEIMLPASWLNASDKGADKGGYLGIFFMATTLALVSFSCTGPIIGTLLVQAATMGQLLGPATGMFGFALALALPFTLFAMFPSWMNALPKSGGWLNSVKIILGFLEIALALKFLSNVDLAYHWQWFDREIFLTLWIAIFALLTLYLLGKIQFSHDSPLAYLSVPRLFLAIISLAFTVYMVPGLWGAPLDSIAAFLPPQHTQDFDLYTQKIGSNNLQASQHPVRKYGEIFHAPLNLDTFFDYEEGMAYAKANHKPVMIDFTGHACVNCRKMEATVWSKHAVLTRLQNDYVVIQLYVDDKTELAKPEQYFSTYSQKQITTIGKKWSEMQAKQFNTNSQPYYVLLDNEGQTLVKPQGASYDENNFLSFLESGLKAYHTR